MLNYLIKNALHNRFLVLALAFVLMLAGAWVTTQVDVDVFPDLTAPTVTVMTEAHGMSAEEIERLVTVPTEIAMTGLPDLVEMRSLIKSGLSIITLVFTDDTDVYFAILILF